MARYGPGSFLGGLGRSGLPGKRNVTGLTGLSQFHRKKRPVRHHGAGAVREHPAARQIPPAAISICNWTKDALLLLVRVVGEAPTTWCGASPARSWTCCRAWATAST